MPWCPECDRFLSPSSVRPDGTCPACGRTVDPGRAHAPAAVEAVPAEKAEAKGEAKPGAKGEGGEDEEPLPIPWHLKVLAGATAVYLGYRALQGIEWLVGRF